MANSQAAFGSPDPLPDAVPLPAPQDPSPPALDSDPVSVPAPVAVSTPEPSPVTDVVPPQSAAPTEAVVPAPSPAQDTTSVLPTNTPLSGTIASLPPTAPAYNAWNEAPVVLGVALGAAVFISLILLGCFAMHRRRQWKKRNLDIPSMSETQTLISRRSTDLDILPKHEKRFDLENPAPVYLGKGQGQPIFPHLKTLHLLSRSGSIASTSTSTSTLTNGSNRGKRVYSTQPPIPSVSVTYDHPRTSLPDGFESYIYALRSPQFIDGKIAKRLSLVSNISTIRFARDSQGWALRRGSDCSLDRATVFDDDQHKETSPPLLAASVSSESRRASQKPRRKPPPLPHLDIVAAHGRYEDVSDIQYQPTPLAPPPAQIRARSVTPTNFVVRQTASIESADALVGGAMESIRDAPSAPKQYNQLAPSARPSHSILHSAVAKGKVSRQEAESVLGVRIAITP